MRQELIGYLLGALNADERQMVEQELAANPDLCGELERLRGRLNTLFAKFEVEESREGLVSRTCAAIEAFDEEHKAFTAGQAARNLPAYSSSSVGRWSLTDLVVAAGVCVCASLLFFPAIANSRFQAQVSACQDNLRQIGNALQAYNSYYHNYFPPVPCYGKLATAGCYTVLLRDQQLVSDPQTFVCPSSPLAEQRHTWYLPTRQEIDDAHGPTLGLLRRTMGGSYAYTLGHLSRGQYQPTRNLGRSYFVVMADVPSPHLDDLRSPNHAGRGQNVLFEDFHVKYVTECCTAQGGDEFFVNRAGLPTAGLDIEDAVVGGSDTSPLALIGR